MPAMIFHYTLRGSIQVPEGSSLNDTGTGINLPNGETLKLFEGWEVNTNDEGHRDLEYTEMAERDCYYDGAMTRFEEGEE